MTEALAAALTPSLTLRPYQKAAVEAVILAHQRGIHRALIALPTGTGKTIVFAQLIRRRKGRALVLAHRDELIEQAVQKLLWVDPSLDIGVVKAERDEHQAGVVVASVQTLSRKARLQRLRPDFDTVVIDEAHHATADSYLRILQHCRSFKSQGPLVLGVTATPQRGDRQSLKRVFQHIVYQKSLLEMIQQAYLADLRAVQVMLQADFDHLRTRKGDFVEADLEAMLVAADAPGQVLDAFETHALERKTIVFTPTVAMAHAMAQTFQQGGIPAEALDGGTPLSERRDILRRLHRGETRVVANCAVLTEGFDEPSIDCIIIARPTKSRTLYQQMIGRGTRLYPGKTDCLIVDVVGVSAKHTLQTAAFLFDCDAKKLAENALTKVKAEQLRAQTQEQATIEGPLHSTRVDLFARRALHWVQTRQGAWVLSLGEHGTMRLQPDGNETWGATLLKRGADPTPVAHHLPLDYAQGFAETLARDLGMEWLVSAEAPWRSHHASAKQMELLKRFGIAIKVGLTKGEAADQISAVMGDWD